MRLDGMASCGFNCSRCVAFVDGSRCQVGPNCFGNCEGISFEKKISKKQGLEAGNLLGDSETL